MSPESLYRPRKAQESRKNSISRQSIDDPLKGAGNVQPAKVAHCRARRARHPKHQQPAQVPEGAHGTPYVSGNNVTCRFFRAFRGQAAVFRMR